MNLVSIKKINRMERDIEKIMKIIIEVIIMVKDGVVEEPVERVTRKVIETIKMK